MSTLPPLDAVTGALLIGTWASSLLYMAEATQFIFYWRHFQNDDWKLRIFVATAFTLDTVSSLGDCACVYLYIITHAGDALYLTKQNWAVPLYIISTGVIAISVQSFLIIRYWRFTHNTALSVFMGILALASLAGDLVSGLIIILFPAFKDREKVRISGMVWIITQVSADFLIAASLIWEFRKAQSTIPVSRRVNNTIKRSVILSIQSGSATAAITIAALIVFFINDETNIPVGITFMLGRVYMLSMLFNLNLRTRNRTETSTAATASGLRTRGGGTVHGLSGQEFSSIRFGPSIVHTQLIENEIAAETFKSNSTSDNIPTEELEMISISSKRPAFGDV